MRFFAEAGYRVLALDLPGYGDSEKPDSLDQYHVRVSGQNTNMNQISNPPLHKFTFSDVVKIFLLDFLDFFLINATLFTIAISQLTISINTRGEVPIHTAFLIPCLTSRIEEVKKKCPAPRTVALKAIT